MQASWVLIKQILKQKKAILMQGENNGKLGMPKAADKAK